MTLILQGTDNSVSSPAVQGGTAGTTTGVYYPASNQVALATNGTLALIVDSSQNVGIGTASPNKKLEVLSVGEIIRATSNTGGNDQNISIKSNSGTADCSTNIFFADRYAASSYASSYIRGTASGTSPLIFATGGTNFTNIYDAGAPVERMRVNAGAPILCLAGGNTSATGTGIAFPATQSASSDANTLDDYEEGTWTPGLSASGYTFGYGTRAGWYTKIGRVVYVKAYFTTNATPTGSGTVTGNITGLPFTSSNDASSYGAWSIAPESGSAFFSRTCAVRGYPSSTQAVIFNGWGGSAVQTAFNWSTIGSFEWEISGFYFID